MCAPLHGGGRVDRALNRAPVAMQEVVTVTNRGDTNAFIERVVLPDAAWVHVRPDPPLPALVPAGQDARLYLEFDARKVPPGYQMSSEILLQFGPGATAQAVIPVGMRVVPPQSQPLQQPPHASAPSLPAGTASPLQFERTLTVQLGNCGVGAVSLRRTVTNKGSAPLRITAAHWGVVSDALTDDSNAAAAWLRVTPSPTLDAPLVIPPHASASLNFTVSTQLLQPGRNYSGTLQLEHHTAPAPAAAATATLAAADGAGSLQRSVLFARVHCEPGGAPTPPTAASMGFVTFVAVAAACLAVASSVAYVAIKLIFRQPAQKYASVLRRGSASDEEGEAEEEGDDIEAARMLKGAMAACQHQGVVWTQSR